MLIAVGVAAHGRPESSTVVDRGAIKAVIRHEKLGVRRRQRLVQAHDSNEVAVDSIPPVWLPAEVEGEIVGDTCGQLAVRPHVSDAAG